ncbi:peptidase M10 [Ferruginibacter sp. SUN106]|uniref:peptidase M10 n=1 Tax=Ferruginibacter sp. SUN106 TaxID=2978348 RepID=UPI003D363D1F
MGEAEILKYNNQLIIHAVIFIYGDAANDEIATFIAADIAHYWNEANGKAKIKNEMYAVQFNIEGIWSKALIPEMIYENTNPRNNYFRIEEYASGNISFVDGINSNTGYFKLDNLLNKSTTAAHEFGHTIGLDHPEDLDIRGKGTPGIMYPRGTIVDKAFQYDPAAEAHAIGGTMSPFTRKVLQQDIDNLKLHKLDFDAGGLAVIGGFTSLWHPKQVP